MNWTKGRDSASGKESAYFMDSDYGFRICKTLYNGDATYTAFAPLGKDGRDRIGMRKTAEEAKELCQKWYDGE